MTTITRTDARRLLQALDLDDDDLREGYSGRSMYEAECFGIVLEVETVIVGVALCEVFGEDAWDMARAARTDNMGYSTIIYFPGWTVAEED